VQEISWASVLVLSGIVVVVMLLKSKHLKVESRSWWTASGLTVLSIAVCSSVLLFGIHGRVASAACIVSMALAMASLFYLWKGRGESLKS
jgi:hypothetical protein